MVVGVAAFEPERTLRKTTEVFKAWDKDHFF